MRHHRQWQDHRFTVGWEIYAQFSQPIGFFHAHDDSRVDNLIADLFFEHFIPMLLYAPIDDLWWYLEIEVSSSGYWEPQTATDPAEGEDERTLVAVRIQPSLATGYDQSKTLTLPKEVAAQIFEVYREAIQAYEIGSVNDEPPEDC